MIVLTIPVAAFLVGLIVTLALFPDTKQPIRDGLGLLWSRRHPITDLEISNCNCTHDPALHVVGLVGRHLAGKRLVPHHAVDPTHGTLARLARACSSVVISRLDDCHPGSFYWVARLVVSLLPHWIDDGMGRIVKSIEAISHQAGRDIRDGRTCIGSVGARHRLSLRG